MQFLARTSSNRLVNAPSSIRGKIADVICNVPPDNVVLDLTHNVKR